MFCYFLIKYLLLMYMMLAVNSQSYYTINAPGVIKSNRKYSVVVTLHEASGPCSIRVGIEGPNFKEFQDVNLQPFESQLVDFFPKKLQEGNFSLKAEGLSGLNFKNESLITAILNQGPKIYIQTDKPVYKPQELVKFRFVLLDEHTRPLKTDAPVYVDILDALNIHVKVFRNVSLKHGIFTGEFQLSKYPSLGTWKIGVYISGTYEYFSFKTIQIMNYIVPKFSTSLKVPSYTILENGFIKVALYGKYTFNKYVEGNATIQLWNADNNKMLQAKHVDIQNLGYVDFDLKTIKDINKNDGLSIRGYLTEKYTGKTEEDFKYIQLVKQRYKLIISDDDIEFEDNKPYSIKVQVRHWTGAPVLDRKATVSMAHGGKMYETVLDSNGEATFEFDYEEESDYRFQFKDSRTVFPSIYTNSNLMLNKREFYCRLKLMQKPKLGNSVLIEVSSIINIPYIMYTIMGHASLIRTEYIKLPPNQKSYTISITPTVEMIPDSFIYVYYVHKGNLRYEEMFLKFPREFENQISLSAPETAKPGEDVTITINAQPNSYVGILAVDLSVYLLDKSYDLNRDAILEELIDERSYSPIGTSEYPGIISGLITLTNAHYPFEVLPPPPQVKPYGPTVYRFRKKFPETWIFNNYLINDTETKLTFQIPDTITTWRITAFSNNAVTGFGIVDKPTDITNIQTFFISLNLPFSAKRGEILTVSATIFNYSNDTLDTEVTLNNNNEEFYFMESEKQLTEKSNDHLQQTKYISIAKERGKTVKFLILPIKAGEISLQVLANSSIYSDAVWQKLKVEPEGIPKQKNQALYLSVPEGENISSTFEIDEAENSVPDSDYITFSVGGHYLVPTVENFGNLTEVPSGTGEENMVNFAPSVLILEYLKANGRLSTEKELVKNLISSIEIGYQQQLSFRHFTGGYSVFGMATDEEPNTWLTAYVTRYLIKAAKFIIIEGHIIDSDLEYLASQQKPNGEFLFTGYLLNPNHKDEYGLTAFILLTFLESERSRTKYQEVIQKGVEFLNTNLNKVNHINALCLTTTVIKKAKFRSVDNLIDQINSKCIENNGLKWWTGNDSNPATDIELTANAALTLLDTPGDHTSILKWLIKQRNSNGGFMSSFDTVAGMEALVKFSEKYVNPRNVNLKIAYSAKDKQGNEVASNEFRVDSENISNFQKHELPNTTRHVSYEVQGQGVSLVQLSQQYNINSEQNTRHFNIQIKSTLKVSNEYTLEICFNYKPDKSTVNGTINMVILEVNLPTGFHFQDGTGSFLKKNNQIHSLEIKNSDSTAVLYLDKLKADMKKCLKMEVNKENEILMIKPAAIIMYDYYNSSRSDTKFYSF